MGDRDNINSDNRKQNRDEIQRRGFGLPNIPSNPTMPPVKPPKKKDKPEI